MSMSVSQREQVSPWLGSAGYRMAQKNFFSLKGFSDAGTGESRGSSLAWASQYDVRSAAALETFILSILASILSCSTSLRAWAMLAVLLVAMRLPIQACCTYFGSLCLICWSIQNRVHLFCCVFSLFLYVSSMPHEQYVIVAHIHSLF